MIAYFDSSAVVKLLIDEPGSDTAEEVWRAADARVCATVGLAEVAAALGRAGRMQRLSARALQAAVVDLNELWPAFHRPVIDEPLAEGAAALALEHPLRGYDAVHLAAALASADTFVAADQQLLTAARATGLAIADVAA